MKTYSDKVLTTRTVEKFMRHQLLVLRLRGLDSVRGQSAACQPTVYPTMKNVLLTDHFGTEVMRASRMDGQDWDSDGCKWIVMINEDWCSKFDAERGHDKLPTIALIEKNLDTMHTCPENGL